MTWFSLVCAVISVVLGVVHLIRLATARRDGRSPMGEAAHAAMGLGMAAMFSPLGDPLPAPVWPVVFGAIVVWFGVTAYRSGWFTDDAGHHVVGGVAMLFMALVGSAGHSASGHAGHGATQGAWTSLLALCFAGYFAWHVMRCADRLLAAGRVPAATEAVPVAARVESAGVPESTEQQADAALRPADGGVATAEGDVGVCGCDPGHSGAPAGRGLLALIGTARVAAGTHLMMASVMAAMLLSML